MKRARTSIVATVGPSIAELESLRTAINAGVNVFRLNFSHGTYKTHKDFIEKIRKVSSEMGKPVAILQDLSGPKLRVGKLPEPLNVAPGDFVIIKREGFASANEIPINYEFLIEDLEEEEKILIEDGKISLKVMEKGQDFLKAKVLTGGIIKSEKGVNLPDSSLRVPSFTEKDRENLEFGLKNAVDLIALSFVKSPEDVKAPRKMAGEDIPIIAKIERKEALKNLEEIIEAFDGIMVARGDLGVEVPLERVPLLQKKMITIANRKRKIVITATQMLTTMINNPFPTRAEVSDIANAVLDGTDAVMLSGETAIGKYPIEAVKMMEKILKETEEDNLIWKLRDMFGIERSDPTEAIAESAVITAEKIGASAIVVLTASGRTALIVSKFRPKMPVIALTPDEKVQRRISVLWGIRPERIPFIKNTDQMIKEGIALLKEKHLLKLGEFAVITAGKTPMKGATDMVKVIKVLD